MFERFTASARDVIGAQAIARELGHPRMGTEHLLLALLAPGAGGPARVLAEAGVTAAAVRLAFTGTEPPPPPIVSAEDAAALRTIGIDAEAVLSCVEASLGREALAAPGPAEQRGRGPRRRGAGPGSRFGHTPLSPEAKAALSRAVREAVAMHQGHIGSEHLLLGVAGDAGTAARVLAATGVSLPGLRAAILTAPGDAA